MFLRFGGLIPNMADIYNQYPIFDRNDPIEVKIYKISKEIFYVGNELADTFNLKKPMIVLATTAVASYLAFENLDFN